MNFRRSDAVPRLERAMVCPLLALRNDLGKSGSTISRSRLKMKSQDGINLVEELPRKPSRAKFIVTVPQTDTGG